MYHKNGTRYNKVKLMAIIIASSSPEHKTLYQLQIIGSYRVRIVSDWWTFSNHSVLIHHQRRRGQQEGRQQIHNQGSQDEEDKYRIGKLLCKCLGLGLRNFVNTDCVPDCGLQMKFAVVHPPTKSCVHFCIVTVLSHIMKNSYKTFIR